MFQIFKHHKILALIFIKHFEIFEALSKKVMTVLNFITHISKIH